MPLQLVASSLLAVERKQMAIYFHFLLKATTFFVPTFTRKHTARKKVKLNYFPIII
jgi:hypothetical protein